MSDEVTSRSDEFECEYRKIAPVFHTMTVATAVMANNTTPPFHIDPTRYSSWTRLTRITSICLKFVKLRVWNRVRGLPHSISERSVEFLESISDQALVTCSDMELSRNLWIKYSQQLHYGDVIASMEINQPHALVKQMGLLMDNADILRCDGRMQNADLSTDAVYPKLLAKYDFVTSLIIRDIHARLFHSGVGHTLSQLRTLYWVPQGRAVVRKVINSCKLCKKYKGAPFALPTMPPWPRQRLSRSRPFEFTGLDYFGPINVKVGVETQKMWICLFTCLAVRAIHLECVAEANAKEFLRCLIRFVARRGTPSQIISDNAPQFKVTKNALDRIWHSTICHESVISYAANAGITWKFTTELAPWQGGFYERLVGLVKSAMRYAIGRRLLTWQELITITAEVEAIINSRPITYVYSDYKSGKTLRPTDFLTELPNGMPNTDANLNARGLGDVGKSLVAMWKLKQSKLDAIWTFWQNEYLLSLRERSNSQHKGPRHEIRRSPDVGEVVLVKDSDCARGCWKVGEVTRIIVGQDGRCRSAEVKIPNGLTIKRPINHLYPLEIYTTAQNPTRGATETGSNSDEEDGFEGFTEQEVMDSVQRVNDQDTARLHISNGLMACATKLCFSS